MAPSSDLLAALSSFRRNAFVLSSRASAADARDNQRGVFSGTFLDTPTARTFAGLGQ